MRTTPPENAEAAPGDLCARIRHVKAAGREEMAS